MPELSGIGIIAAFVAGAVSFLSPCVLPLVPGYVSYVAGRTPRGVESGHLADGRLSAAALSVCFIGGFSTVFVILGASATALGQMMLGYRYELNIVGGAIIIGFGLFMLGMARLNVLQRDLRIHLAIPGGKPLSAYVLGFAFGFGWTPCIGPILGAILTASAASATVAEGVALLSNLFGRTGRAIPPGSPVHGSADSEDQVDRTPRPTALSRRRHRHGRDGDCHDDRTVVCAVILALGRVSSIGSDWLTGHQKGSSRKEIDPNRHGRMLSDLLCSS